VVKGLVLGWSEWGRWGGLWLSFSFEVAFEDKSDDKIYDGKANGISDYSSNCSYPVRIVEIQLRISIRDLGSHCPKTVCKAMFRSHRAPYETVQEIVFFQIVYRSFDCMEEIVHR